MSVRIRLRVNETYVDGDWGASLMLNNSGLGGVINVHAEVLSIDGIDGPRPGAARRVTPEDGLTAILWDVKTAADSFETAGKWLTRITNEITSAIREDDKP